MRDCIDIHTHVVPESFPPYAGRNANVPWPSMAEAHACHKHVMISGKVYRTVADDAELLLLAVRPEIQGRGVGRDLLGHFIEHSKDNGATRIHLEVREGNPAARVYRAAGFVEANRRRNYYRGREGRQYDALTFVLSAKV